MKISLEDKYKGKGRRVCKICANARGLIRKYKLNICRRCFREVAEKIGFRKYGI
ncbi:MAG TPA: 30S ribosomal protein S14 [Candidatus Bilamarchaeaceae archaeon]|nr:30S ribosomal protein S14 [Candidatus Bilamarchaeaceae archaeon]